MQCDACVLRPAPEPVMYHLGVQVPQHRRLEAELADEKGTGRDIQYSSRECFVKRCVCVSEARKAGTRPQRLGECGA